ncbi:MAG: response regulator [Planctomycetaceae bacterium]|nr:response regulator [Planctomycetaceae bacterium]
MKQQIVVIQFVVVSLVSYSALAVGRTSGDPIADIQTVNEMTGAEASTSHGCEFEATVYYSDPSGAWFVAGRQRNFIVVTNCSEFLAPGTRVRIHGETGRHPEHLGNVIRLRDLEQIAAASNDFLIEAMPLDVNHIGEIHTPAWVTAELTVSSLLTDDDSIVMVASHGDTRFAISDRRSVSVPEAAEVVGCTLHVTGNLRQHVDRNSPVRFSIDCPRGYVRVVREADVPLQPEAIGLLPDVWGDRVSDFRVNGQVTFTTPWWFYLQRDRHGLFLHNRDGLPVSTGDLVDVAGVKELFPDGGGSLVARSVSVAANAPFPDVPESKVGEVTAENSESIRIRVRGIYQNHETSGTPDKIFLRADDRLFEVHIWSQSVDPLELRTARVIEAVGTCSVHGATDSDFIVHAPALGDITVIERMPFWTPTTIGLAALILTGAFVGVITIRGLRLRLHENRTRVANLNAQLQLVSKTIRDGIMIFDNDGHVAHCNHRTTEILGFSVCPGDAIHYVQERISQRLAEGAPAVVWAESTNDRNERGELSLRLNVDSDNAPRVIELYLAPIIDLNGDVLGRLWSIYDVTERQQWLERLAESEKQTAIGQLAGGFAHDFNNLLTAIQNSLILTKEDELPAGDRAHDFLNIALEATDRATELVSQLLSYSRKIPLNQRPQDINELVNQVTQLLRPMLRDRSIYSTQLEKKLPFVNVDHARLQQVLLNLCLNAVDAVENGGEIVVSTYLQPGPEFDDEVVLSVRDTGCGITRDNLKQVFEPFFTTKQEKGTGLGLAMAQGIVRQHGGRISCESELGKGSEFRIYLTAIEHETDVGRGVSSLAATSPIGRRCVLVVDDEPLVLKSVQMMLKARGATTFAAGSGQEALEILRQHHDIDIVLLDWSMPGMHGRDVLREIKQSRPGVITIICTGCVSDVESTTFAPGMAPDGMQQKPYGLEQISNILSEHTVEQDGERVCDS